MDNILFKKWCEAAASKIRYKPDRKEVEAELMAHMEDKRDALREKGIPEAELEEAVLRSMGSAETIASQLAAIHKPFWGYVETVTRVLAISSVIFLIVFTPVIWDLFLPNLFYEQEDRHDVFTHTENGFQKRILYLEPNVSVALDGYTITVTRAAMWQIPDEPYFPIQFPIEIEVTGIRPWAQTLTAMEYFWAEDDLGNYYYSAAESTVADQQSLNLQITRRTPLRCTYLLHIPRFLSQEAQWLELHYRRDGRDITLRIDMTGGAAS